MPVTLLLALLAAEPPATTGGAAVLISRRLSVSAEDALALASKVEAVLRKAGVPVREAADVSSRRVACLELPDPSKQVLF